MKIKDRKPNLFERTDSSIWTDPYIQQQMLKVHLDQDSDGASRKKTSIIKIIDFIDTHANHAGRLLDLGCGPGLYTSVFKDKDYEVTGIDFNKASIEYAKEERKDITYILGDYIEQYPEGNYDMVIMIYCDLGTHSDANRNKLLHHIYNSLNEGGTFIFDVFTEELVKDKQETKSWEHSPSGGFWSSHEYLLLSQTFHYPEQKAFAYQYNLLTDKEDKHFIVWDRYYSPEEITTILKGIGFRNVSIQSNILDSNNFTSNHEMFVVAKK